MVNLILLECMVNQSGRGRTCTCEGETPLDLQSSAFAAQPNARIYNINYTLNLVIIQ